MNKTVIITGSEGAIGSACKKLFEDNGWNVFGIDVVNGHDISKPGTVSNLLDSAIDKYGRIDALINSAAANAWMMDPDDDIEERWDKTFSNDLKSMYLMSEASIVQMVKNGGGNVINIGSIAGYVLGSKSLPYAATKAAVVGMTKSHARIYGSYNIKVNNIAPGIIDNDRTTKAEHEVKMGYNTAIKNQTPLNRWGTPQEIAELAFFLGSDKCGFLTGQTIVVDGGATLTCGLRVDEPQPFRYEKFPPKR